jgi:hypothetical protein
MVQQIAVPIEGASAANRQFVLFEAFEFPALYEKFYVFHMHGNFEDFV